MKGRMPTISADHIDSSRHWPNSVFINFQDPLKTTENNLPLFRTSYDFYYTGLITWIQRCWRRRRVQWSHIAFITFGTSVSSCFADSIIPLLLSTILFHSARFSSPQSGYMACVCPATVHSGSSRSSLFLQLSIISAKSLQFFSITANCLLRLTQSATVSYLSLSIPSMRLWNKILYSHCAHLGLYLPVSSSLQSTFLLDLPQILPLSSASWQIALVV